MNTPLTRTLAVIAFALIWLPQNSLAQRTQEALSNPVIMHYYTVEQINELAANDTTELNAVIYYFTLSYRVEPIACFDCIPFDSASFDITKYEHLRLEDEVFVRDFDKYGFRLTLYPINAMPYYYGIQHVPQIDPGDTQNPQQR